MLKYRNNISKNLQLSRKCFQKTKYYRNNFIKNRESYLAISWQKYAIIPIFQVLCRMCRIGSVYFSGYC